MIITAYYTKLQLWLVVYIAMYFSFIDKSNNPKWVIIRTLFHLIPYWHVLQLHYLSWSSKSLTLSASSTKGYNKATEVTLLLLVVLKHK